MSGPLLADTFHEALVAVGVVGDGEQIRRIVIDALVGEPVVMHIERFGDLRLIDVVSTLHGVQIHAEMRIEVPDDADPDSDLDAEHAEDAARARVEEAGQR